MKNFVAYVRSMLRKKAFLNVFAEEPTNPSNEPNNGGGEPNPNGGDPNQTPTTKTEPKPNGSVNFEDLVKKAREEEKAKLYPEITKLKEKNNNLLLVVQERDNTITEQAKKIEKLEKDNGKITKSLEEGTATNKTVSELTLQVSTLEKQLEELQGKYDTDVNALKLESYKEKKIAEANGEIIPELVIGNSEEEVNASFETAKAKYAEITQRALQGVQMPAVNPSATTIQLKEKSIEEIATMSAQDWAEQRKALGLK